MNLFWFLWIYDVGKGISEAFLSLRHYHSSTLKFTKLPHRLPWSVRGSCLPNSGRSLWFARPTGPRTISARCRYSTGTSQVRASAVGYISYVYSYVYHIMTSNHQWYEGNQWTEPLGRCCLQEYSKIHQRTLSTGGFYNPKNSSVICAWHVMTCALQRYLAELVLAQQPLPRRQEAESEKFISGGITQSALVTHEEVQEWATGSRKAIMCSISHAWETREHPDPCRQGTGLLRNFFFFYATIFCFGIVFCFGSGVEPTHFVDFPFSLFIL